MDLRLIILTSCCFLVNCGVGGDNMASRSQPVNSEPRALDIITSFGSDNWVGACGASLPAKFHLYWHNRDWKIESLGESAQISGNSVKSTDRTVTFFRTEGAAPAMSCIIVEGSARSIKVDDSTTASGSIYLQCNLTNVFPVLTQDCPRAEFIMNFP